MTVSQMLQTYSSSPVISSPGNSYSRSPKFSTKGTGFYSSSSRAAGKYLSSSASSRYSSSSSSSSDGSLPASHISTPSSSYSVRNDCLSDGEGFQSASYSKVLRRPGWTPSLPSYGKGFLSNEFRSRGCGGPERIHEGVHDKSSKHNRAIDALAGCLNAEEQVVKVRQAVEHGSPDSSSNSHNNNARSGPHVLDATDPDTVSCTYGIPRWVFSDPCFSQCIYGVNSPLLWISADSINDASALAQQLAVDGLKCFDPLLSTICHFTFDATIHHSLHEGLRTVLHQLLECQPHLLQHAQITAVQKECGSKQALTELWKLLLTAISVQNAASTVCIFDALDECQDSDLWTFIGLLGELHNNRMTAQNNLRVLVTSRTNGFVSEGFYKCIQEVAAIHLDLSGIRYSPHISNRQDTVASHSQRSISGILGVSFNDLYKRNVAASDKYRNFNVRQINANYERARKRATLYDAVQQGAVKVLHHVLESSRPLEASELSIHILQCSSFLALQGVAKLALNSKLFNQGQYGKLNNTSWDLIDLQLRICNVFETSQILRLVESQDIGLSLIDKHLTSDGNQDRKLTMSLHGWEVPQVVRSWLTNEGITKDSLKVSSSAEDLMEKLLQSIVILGKGSAFKAVACGSYIRKTWGQFGLHVTKVVIKAALSGIGQPSISYVFLEDHCATMVAYAVFGHICLVCSDLDDSYVHQLWDIVQWLCKVLRANTNQSGGLQSSQGVRIGEQKKKSCKLAAFSLKPLSKLEVEDACCWLPLFQSGIVVDHDVDTNPKFRGIELDFDLMASLAAVETYYRLETERSIGHILLGFFTALIPVWEDRDAVQWHFEYSEADALKPLDLELVIKQNWLHKEDLAELSKKRCFVGIWPQANVLLGTYGYAYNVNYSGLKSKQRTLHTEGYEAMASIGFSGGPVQGILQGTKAYSFTSNVQSFSRESCYAQILDRASRQVALVYDTNSETGWLVPQLSLLLHLCHMYHAHFRNFAKQKCDPIPWALPSDDGASAAREALDRAGNIVVTGDGGRDSLRLRALLVDLNANLRASHTTREPPKLSRFGSSKLYLTEMRDQIEAPSYGSPLRVLDVQPSVEAWIHVVTRVDSVLACKDFGKPIAAAIIPSASQNASQRSASVSGSTCTSASASTFATDTSSTSSTASASTSTATSPSTCTSASTFTSTSPTFICKCGDVPEKCGYLVAHARCLQLVLQRPGGADAHNQLTWNQSGEPFEPPTHSPHDPCSNWSGKVLQRLMESTQISPCPGFPLEGAVVFGDAIKNRSRVPTWFSDKITANPGSSGSTKGKEVRYRDGGNGMDISTTTCHKSNALENGQGEEKTTECIIAEAARTLTPAAPATGPTAPEPVAVDPKPAGYRKRRGAKSRWRIW
ncbi:hypothetical protein K461DRAFT_291198 [Myriangium duriaei CBS 260.36]|uniref:Nephrocystin 3-like N-terminal domain-containing protein n=1 Tax=Myriangium duriaei CBS 260.36 TaxID=1168546 RepID=A0A9P4J8Y0_9PEZI|nr:hypothetical protein K461DRAFT_291198 [Myriangium duriaei CBS 260.36]